MVYTMQDVQEQLSIVSEDIEEYVRENKIKVGKGGTLSTKAYQTLLDFYSAEKNIINEKPVYVLNGIKINVKTKAFF